ncbi:hypothetical protein BDB01DRAFT_900050 [Pilobolus umbonatus]|nr:hypothetical protein BDB01DRAFT_900050 [Pilobolus umbonatus]
MSSLNITAMTLRQCYDKLNRQYNVIMVQLTFGSDTTKDKLSLLRQLRDEKLGDIKSLEAVMAMELPSINLKVEQTRSLVGVGNSKAKLKTLKNSKHLALTRKSLIPTFSKRRLLAIPPSFLVWSKILRTLLISVIDAKTSIPKSVDAIVTTSTTISASISTTTDNPSSSSGDTIDYHTHLNMPSWLLYIHKRLGTKSVDVLASMTEELSNLLSTTQSRIKSHSAQVCLFSDVTPSAPIPSYAAVASTLPPHCRTFISKKTIAGYSTPTADVEPISNILSKLITHGLQTNCILDIYYPDNKIVVILVHDDYSLTVLDILQSYDIEVNIDFNPLASTTLYDPKYSSLSDEISKLHDLFKTS